MKTLFHAKLKQKIVSFDDGGLGGFQRGGIPADGQD